jgi:CDP-diacylglycerol--glycerol-3-phosphate 3-phosphatidyltransferase
LKNPFDPIMNLANIITGLRLICGILFPILFIHFKGNYDFFLFIFFIIICLTDIVDGWVARRFNMVTKTGKLLDSFADKILLTGGLFCLIYGRLIPVWFISTLLIREFGITCYRAYLIKKHNLVIESSDFGKLKNWFQMVTISYVLFLSYFKMYSEIIRIDIVLNVLLVSTLVITIESGLSILITGGQKTRQNSNLNA